MAKLLFTKIATKKSAMNNWGTRFIVTIVCISSSIFLSLEAFLIFGELKLIKKKYLQTRYNNYRSILHFIALESSNSANTEKHWENVLRLVSHFMEDEAIGGIDFTDADHTLLVSVQDTELKQHLKINSERFISLSYPISNYTAAAQAAEALAPPGHQAAQQQQLPTQDKSYAPLEILSTNAATNNILMKTKMREYNMITALNPLLHNDLHYNKTISYMLPNNVSSEKLLTIDEQAFSIHLKHLQDLHPAFIQLKMDIEPFYKFRRILLKNSLIVMVGFLACFLLINLLLLKVFSNYFRDFIHKFVVSISRFTNRPSSVPGTTPLGIKSKMQKETQSLMKIFNDVSLRLREHKSTLSRRIEEHNYLIENIQQPIIQLNEHAEIMAWNSAAAKCFNVLPKHMQSATNNFFTPVITKASVDAHPFNFTNSIIANDRARFQKMFAALIHDDADDNSLELCLLSHFDNKDNNTTKHKLFYATVQFIPVRQLNPKHKSVPVTNTSSASNKLRLYLFIHDITKYISLNINLTHAKSAAEAASSTKRLFFSSLSHEFRTPLNSIINLSRLLHDDHKDAAKSSDTSELTKALSMIETSGRRLLKLFTNILEISALEANAQALSARVFTLADVIERAQEISHNFTKHKPISLEFKNLDANPAPGTPVQPNKLIGDPIFITQTLVYCIILICDRLKTVKMVVSYQLAHSLINFKIHAETVKQSHPFKPNKPVATEFSSLAPKKAVEKNLEESLFLLKQNVKLMGGAYNIVCKPTAQSPENILMEFNVPQILNLQTAATVTANSLQDTATTAIVPATSIATQPFSVAEPKEPPPTAPKQAASNPPPQHQAPPSPVPATDVMSAPATRPIILIIEDEAFGRETLKLALRHYKAVDFHFAVNGAEAFAKVKAEQAHIIGIFMDMMLPDTNGFALFKQFRLIIPQIPVIAFTAHTEKAFLDKIFTSNFFDYLSKPFSQSELIEKCDAFKLAAHERSIAVTKEHQRQTPNKASIF